MTPNLKMEALFLPQMKDTIPQSQETIVTHPLLTALVVQVDPVQRRKLNVQQGVLMHLQKDLAPILLPHLKPKWGCLDNITACVNGYKIFNAFRFMSGGRFLYGQLTIWL